jgi:HlyD family secretion protein
LDLAQRKVSSRKAKRLAELARTQIGVDKARLAARRLARMVLSCTVHAPAEGAVVITETWSNDGNRKMRVGDSIGEGRAFMRLADLSRFQVRGVVPEERVDEVRPGQPVRFWLPTAVDHVFSGKVQSVGTVARAIQTAISFSDRSSARRAFDLVVSTDEHAARFQPGLSVRYEVELARLRRVPVVPVEAVHFDQEGPYVRLPSGERRPVVLGEESDGEVQVGSGLAPGEVVCVRP